MRLPNELQRGIHELTAGLDRGMLTRAALELSSRYRCGDLSLVSTSPAHRAAYLAVRMPATYAANRQVFQEVRRLLPQLEIGSLLDLGAGPGTSMWAAVESFPGIQRATLLERNRAMLQLGKQLAEVSSHEALRAATWINADLSSVPAAQVRQRPPGKPQRDAPSAVQLHLEPHDLVVISYALGELPTPAAEEWIAAAWQHTQKLLVIIEPGTPRHFATVLAVRQRLITQGAQVLAPCPHHEVCPLATANDWCHFAARLERTSEHRRLKGGELGYEDEKFSYIIASRLPIQAENRRVPGPSEAARPRARIVRHPLFRPGHVQLTLCTAEGLRQETIGRADKPAYRAARKANWGDSWDS